MTGDDGCTGSPDCSDEDTGDAGDSDDGDDSDATDSPDTDDDTDDDDTDDTDDITVESPSWTGVEGGYESTSLCDHSFGGSTTADEGNDQQTIMLQLFGSSNDLYAVTRDGLQLEHVWIRR